MARIVYVTAAAYPSRAANTIQVMKMCQAVTNLGHEVRLLARTAGGPKVVDDPGFWQQYGIRNRFPVDLLRRHPNLPARVAGQFFAFQAARRARRERPDAVFTRDPGTAAWSIRWGLPTVLEFHGVCYSRSEGFYMRLIGRMPGRRRFVATTTPVLQELRRLYPAAFERGDTLIESGGVDLEPFERLGSTQSCRREVGLPEGRPIVGYSGHLYPGKGSEMALALAERRPEITFFIAGGAPADVDRVRAFVREKSLNNVHVAGFVPNERVPLWLGAADVLLLPLQERVEDVAGNDIVRWTSPLKLFEYMASRRPVIVSDVPVLREVVNERNSFLCPPANVGAWERALDFVLGHPADAGRVAEQAGAEVRERSWERRAARCLAGFLEDS